MIKIKSTRELVFDPISRKKGFIEVEIILYSRNPRQKTYNLTIEDRLIIPTTMMEPFHIPAKYNEDGTIKEEERWEEREIEYFEYESRQRYKTYKDSELDQLIQAMGIEEPITVSNIDEIFSQGLLFITQQECEEGKGIYFSEAKDWVKG